MHKIIVMYNVIDTTVRSSRSLLSQGVPIAFTIGALGPQTCLVMVTEAWKGWRLGSDKYLPGTVVHGQSSGITYWGVGWTQRFEISLDSLD